MSSIIKRNLDTLLATGDGSLRSCLEQARLKARNGREIRMIGFSYEDQGGILTGSFTLTVETRADAPDGCGRLMVEYDTATFALRILRVYVSAPSASTARHELEFTKQAYNGLHGQR